LAPSGNPGIRFRDASNQDLQYAKYDGTDWTIETVDEVGNAGVYTALGIDALGNIGIGYSDSTNTDLKFAFAQGPAAVPALSPGAVGSLLVSGPGWSRWGIGSSSCVSPGPDDPIGRRSVLIRKAAPLVSPAAATRLSH
jgi:hypothetical protein